MNRPPRRPAAPFVRVVRALRALHDRARWTRQPPRSSATDTRSAERSAPPVTRADPELPPPEDPETFNDPTL